MRYDCYEAFPPYELQSDSEELGHEYVILIFQLLNTTVLVKEGREEGYKEGRKEGSRNKKGVKNDEKRMKEGQMKGRLKASEE